MDRNEVINKAFPHSLIGYDPIAVDAFLDEVIREFDRMTNTIDVLQFRLAQQAEITAEFEKLAEHTEGPAHAPELPAPEAQEQQQPADSPDTGRERPAED